MRSFNILKYLSRRYKVYLGAFVDDPADLTHIDALRGMCADCHVIPLSSTIAKFKCLSGLVSGGPLTLTYYRSASMQRWVDSVLLTESIQSVLVFSAAMAQYVMHAKHITRVADLVDVDSEKWKQYAATTSWPYSIIYRRESRLLLRYERRIASEFNSTVFVSSVEADLFRNLAPEVVGKVWHVSNGVDSNYFSPDRPYANPYGEYENVIVFTGAMDYWPNVDAVVEFARSAFPQIRARDPSVLFYIVGSKPTKDVQLLADLPGVFVTGFVPDIRPYLAYAKLVVAPLRIARGMQNKVLEAMAMAKRVIVSPQAAEGILAEDGKEFIMASNISEFIQSTLHLLGQKIGNNIGESARLRVLNSYSWEESLTCFDRLLTRTDSFGDSDQVSD